MTRFASKDAARQHVWDTLESRKLARFPFPPHGRIPNFAGAREAAERLLEAPLLRGARRIKVNPDAPQLPLRAAALARGIDVYMPTPRLRAGFLWLAADAVPTDRRRRAASLSGLREYARPVALTALPELDAIVCGSVAVTTDGARAGKGEGYSDLEFAILRELGHPPVPVATTVHECQIVEALPSEPTDLAIGWVATPERTFEIEAPHAPPSGIDWDRIDDDALAAMPVLAELRALRPPDS